MSLDQYSRVRLKSLSFGGSMDTRGHSRLWLFYSFIVHLLFILVFSISLSLEKSYRKNEYIILQQNSIKVASVTNLPSKLLNQKQNLEKQLDSAKSNQGDNKKEVIKNDNAKKNVNGSPQKSDATLNAEQIQKNTQNSSSQEKRVEVEKKKVSSPNSQDKPVLKPKREDDRQPKIEKKQQKQQSEKEGQYDQAWKKMMKTIEQDDVKTKDQNQKVQRDKEKVVQKDSKKESEITTGLRENKQIKDQNQKLLHKDADVNVKKMNKVNYESTKNNVDAYTNKAYNEDLEITISERDAIISQIERAWNLAAFGSSDNKSNMYVYLQIQLGQQGEVLKVETILEKRFQSNPVYKTFVDSAVRAVYGASPLRNLPSEKYHLWREVKLKFDPSNIIY